MSERKASIIKDLAAEVDVHYSTVSRVMNPATRHLVAEEVATRILKLAELRGFRPNRIAAGLRTQRSGLIGVVLPDMANPVFPPILAGIEAVLGRHGYVPIVVNAGVERARQRFVIDQLRWPGGRRAGAGHRRTRRSLLDYRFELGIPVVMVNRGEHTGRASCVVSDSLLAMALTVDHLVSLGHRSIGHIAGPASTSTGQLRRKASCRRSSATGCARRVCRRRGRKLYPGRRPQGLRRVVRNTAGPDAVIAAGNDLRWPWVATTFCASVAVRCPENVLRGTACNDMPLVDALTPPLTTIRIPVHDSWASRQAELRAAQD